MITISAVVTAPTGLANCLLPADFLAEADGEAFEVIVLDASKTYANRSTKGLRHIATPGTDMYQQIAIGLSQAKMDWILLFEDHGQPMPGLLQAYRDAISENPEVDLFSGALENLTSVSPWSFAAFLSGADIFWPPARRNPNHATIAHLLVRRSAILPPELERPGGFEILAVDRLIRAGRYRHCPGAVINHVSLNVKDIQRSGEWYSKMFNLPRVQTAEKDNYMLGLGLTQADRQKGALGHLSIHPTPAGKTPGYIDHFCLGLANFNEAKVVEELKRRGANPQGLHVTDPDGLNIQLNAVDGHA